MVVRRRRKHRRFRGRRTYHGAKKRARGAGTRGGRGKAGLHKHKWTWTVKYAPEHFGKRGFKRPVAVARELRCINLKELDQLADDWLKAGKAKRVGRKIKVNLAELGYDKLLGSGRVSRPFLVEVKQASELAVSKLKRAGGGVRKL